MLLLGRSVLVGSAAGLFGSVVLGIAANFLVGYSHHPLEHVPWLLAVALVPSVVVAAVIGTLVQHRKRTEQRVWWVAAAAAIAVGVLAGSAGAITVQSVRFGLSGVNWTGYLQWSGVYGVALLPLTWPIAWGATRLLWRQNS